MNEYSRLKRAMRFYEEVNLEKLERATTQEEREKRSKRVEAIKKCKEIMADVYSAYIIFCNSQFVKFIIWHYVTSSSLFNLKQFNALFQSI